MHFNKGAIFCNLFLADELNRTSSRTQAALLEAMEERQVTVDGHSYQLENPFSVIATQNPVGASGTQLLPDSQTDRFTVRISMGYPNFEAECQMLINRSLAVVFFHSVSFLFPFSNQIFTLFLVQFVDSLLVLFQMLAQHGIHISAY